MKLSLRIPLFILASVLVLAICSRGDNGIAANDEDLTISTLNQSEPTRECPSDYSEQQRVSLTTEYKSKLEDLRAYIQDSNTKIHQYHSQHTKFVLHPVFFHLLSNLAITPWISPSKGTSIFPGYLDIKYYRILEGPILLDLSWKPALATISMS